MYDIKLTFRASIRSPVTKLPYGAADHRLSSTALSIDRILNVCSKTCYGNTLFHSAKVFWWLQVCCCSWNLRTLDFAVFWFSHLTPQMMLRHLWFTCISVLFLHVIAFWYFLKASYRKLLVINVVWNVRTNFTRIMLHKFLHLYFYRW